MRGPNGIPTGYECYKRGGAALAVVMGIAIPSPSLAQTSGDSAAAQGLYDDARALMAAGNAAEACPKFEESQRLDPGSGTLMNLAQCYEHTGRLASAWSKYLEAAVAAKATGNPERESSARQLAAALAGRVSRLIVNVPESTRVPGLEISRDGGIVGAAQWGVSIPADEGEHEIVAKAPGYAPWRTLTRVTGEGTAAAVSVPALTKTATPALMGTTPGAPASSARAAASGIGTQRVIALVAGGVGVVGVGVWTVFGLTAMSNLRDAEKYCSGNACSDARGVTAGNDAHSAGSIATIGVIVGAAGLGGGFALWLTAPKAGPSTEISFGPGSVRLKEVF